LEFSNCLDEGKGKASGNMKRETKDLLVEINLDHFRERFIKYTRKAFQVLPKLEKPRILDVGCGSGLPTIELAKLSDGEVIGVDIAPSELDRLNRKIEEEGLSSRVKTVKCSVLEMDFPDESFDIIWAEGVIRIMGFKKSIKEWHRLLKPHGFLVVHDAISMVPNKLKGMPNWGYKLVDYFSLPEDVWWTEFYEPLEIRIKELYIKYENNSEALQMLKKYQNEIDMVKRNPKEHSSAFYIMQKS
jgi:ubiquinone/menaquinone biosynthesis C-methylase UbiE